MPRPLQRTDQLGSYLQWSLDRQTWQKKAHHETNQKKNPTSPPALLSMSAAHVKNNSICSQLVVTLDVRANVRSVPEKQILVDLFPYSHVHNQVQFTCKCAHVPPFLCTGSPPCIRRCGTHRGWTWKSLPAQHWWWWQWHRWWWLLTCLLSKQVSDVNVNFSTHWTRLHLYPGDQRRLGNVMWRCWCWSKKNP